MRAASRVDCVIRGGSLQGVAEREILVDGRPMAGVRMSPPFYNTDRELEAAISAVEEILKDRTAAG